MQFNVPFWIWLSLGYAVAFVIFSETGRDILLNFLRGQSTGNVSRRRRKRRKR